LSCFTAYMRDLFNLRSDIHRLKYLFFMSLSCDILIMLGRQLKC
jgi:hypothetical protein